MDYVWLLTTLPFSVWERTVKQEVTVAGAWMHCKSWIGLNCSASQPIFPNGHSWYCSKKSPCSLKSIFFIDHHCKRDVCKTVDRTPRTANNVNYDSFCCGLLIHGGFMFVKLSSSREKRFKNPWRHHNVKSIGRAGARGRGTQVWRENEKERKVECE